MNDLDEAHTFWEAKYSAEQLRDMLAKGHAIRNDQGEPSYPIGDEEDLRKAIRAVGRGGAPHNKIRAYIIRRAKALGRSDLIPDNWTSTGETKEAAQSQTLTEQIPLSEATSGQGRRRRIQLIDAGWSKNGRYYPASTLAEAARNRVYPAGTPMFIDHPTVSEQQERPERSVKDLAARLVTDARYENGALVAEAELFGPWRPVINDMAEHIGVSIRAAGTVEYGEAEGREGPIVTALTEGISVDFVTTPARGGKVLELIESARSSMQSRLEEARRTVGTWLESRLHLAFTEMADDMYGEGRLSRDERNALSAAVGDALAAFTARVEADAPQLYQRDLWGGPDGEVSEAAETADTKKAAASEAAHNAPGSTPADINTDKEGEGSMPDELTEAEARKLREDRDAALAEAEKARNEAAAALAAKRETDLRLARFEATEAARPIAATLLAEAELPAAAQGRLLSSLVRSDVIPLTSDHTLDESAFRKTVSDAIKAEQEYLASLAEQAGIGTPRGLGGSTAQSGGTDDEAVTASLIESYKQRGLSEQAARLAATGRAF